MKKLSNEQIKEATLLIRALYLAALDKIPVKKSHVDQAKEKYPQYFTRKTRRGLK